jgi:hypothetical protein
MRKREQKILKGKRGTDSSSPNQNRSKCNLAANPTCQLRHPAGQRDLKDMEITVQTIMGKDIHLNVKNNSTIKDIKLKLYQSEGIATENQQLVFRDQMLSDIDSVKSLGLTDGSTIKLVVAMVGGPGIYAKKEKADDPVLLLLCHQNEELYMLELYMGEDKTKTLLLKAPSSLSLENYLGETSSSEDIEEVIEGSCDEESVFDSARPTSTFSTSTVFSIISNGTSKIMSRPASSNSLSSASSSLLEEFLSAAMHSTALPGARPATAISIMRLPISSPLIILPKSRPASATITTGGLPVEEKSVEKLEPIDIIESITHADPADPADQIKEFVSETHHKPCSLCKKKVSFSFKCKCGKMFCSLHRYSDRHSCSYDYAEAHRKILRDQLPLVQREKVINLN